MITEVKFPLLEPFMKKLVLTRPIAFTDVEATGTDVVKDRICSVAILKVFPNGDPLQFYSLVNPECPIPPESTECHGITDEMVKDAPVFRDIAPDLLELFHGADIGGYNVRNFDMGILYEEGCRCGVEFKSFLEAKVIDPGNIFKKKEERSLTAAMKFYCDLEYKGAHNALADVKATINVLAAQIGRYDDLPLDVGALSKFCEYDDRMDLAGKIVRNKQGVPVYGFGKSKDVPVLEDRGFANWMLDKDFPEQTKAVLRSILGWPQKTVEVSHRQKQLL
jgi:DNA polymerase-3 subunit epsilon